MARLRREDWLDTGLMLLREHGVQALTIARLCESLQKTKGSFYHHFSDMNAYIGSLLERWRERQTQVAIEVAEKQQDPKIRLEVLDETVRKLDHRLDQIIRFWALEDHRAAEATAEVDRMRLGYLKHLFCEAGIEPAKAEIMADLEYCAFLGAQQRFPDMTSTGARALAEHWRAAMNAWVKRDEG